MYKLIIYLLVVGTKNMDARCYSFEFKTLKAAHRAKKFYERDHCWSEIIDDRTDTEIAKS